MSIPMTLDVAPRTSFLKNDFFLAGVIAVLATAISYLVGISTGWLSSEVNWFEIGAVALNYASFYLSVKRRRVFYLVGFAASALFIVTYLQANLLASAGLAAYLTTALFVGFYMWGKDSKPKLKVEHVQWRWLPVYIAVTAASFAGAYFLVTALGGSFAPADSAILVFTLLAQFLLDRKKLENWWVWIIGVNLAGTILYFVSGLYFAAIQQLVFGIASVWGWVNWYGVYKRGRDMREVPVNNPLDVREDGSIRYGDPAYDAMLEVLRDGRPAVFRQRNDGTWDQKYLD